METRAMVMKARHPVTAADRQAFDLGLRNGKADRLLGYSSRYALHGRYTLNRYALYYGAGYAQGNV